MKKSRFSPEQIAKVLKDYDNETTEPIAQVKILEKDKIEFKWLGFFNKKTIKTIFTISV